MFKFGFHDTEEAGFLKKQNDAQKEERLQWLNSKEVFPTKTERDAFLSLPTRKFVLKEKSILFVSHKDSIKVLSNINKELFEQAEQSHSDLLPSKYEGGLKIWECTYSLLEFLNSEKMQFEGKKVLDLGCGAGFLGIYAMLSGGLVSFQDYNSEVIESVTFPNVVLNLPEKSSEELERQCRFFMGDWASFVELSLNEVKSETDKYDVILSSETIYNASNQWKIILVLKKLLKRTGVAYFAAKTYYFGVGGGFRQFEQKLEEEGGLKSAVCWMSNEGVKREILKIQFTEP